MAELQVIQSYTPKLITAVQDTVNAIGEKCLARQIISEEALSSAFSPGQTNSVKATKLIKAVKNSIKTELSCYATFMTILREELPLESSKKLLDDMERNIQELKESAEKVQQCTESEDKVKVASNTPTRRVIDVPRNPTCKSPGFLTVSRVRKATEGKVKNHDALKEQQGEQQQPVEESEPIGGQPAYPPLASPSSARLRTLENLLEQARSALQDAQQDEAVERKLREEIETLKKQCEQLSKALGEEKQLKEKLADEQAHLKTLTEEKEQERADLNRELEAMKTRLSGTEVQRNELQQRLTQVESEYDSQKATLQNEIDSLKESLNKQKSVIEYIETSLRKKVEELAEQNHKLVNMHVKKDEELDNERKKCKRLEQKFYAIERGFYCSQLAQICVIFVIFVLILTAIVIVAIHRFVEVNYYTSNFYSKQRDL